jgi:hypothetical protein
MANITITVQSLLNTAVYDSYTIDNGQTINQLKTAINTARGFDSTWYDIVQNEHIVSGTATLSSLGITTGTQLRTHNKIARLATKELRQIAKLELAQLDRAATGRPSEYDITQLPAQYVGDVATNNLNEGGLQQGRPWVTFLPSNLFAASEKGVWYDPGDITTLFQDTAGTIPVTASGQTVALMLDKSGNGINATQSDATKRPTFTIYPGTEYGYLNFDGTNDFMVTGNLTFAATSVSTITATVGVQVDTGATGSRIVIELGTDTSISNGSFYITAPSTAGDHSFGLRGDAFITAVVANVNPSDDILTAQLNIGAATKELELIPRLNGVVKSGAGITWSGDANAGTGTFGTKAMYIGARAGTSLFFKGKFYGMVVRGATSSASEITNTEAWVTARLY